MSRSTTLTAAAVLLAALGSLTACGPADDPAPASGSSVAAPAPAKSAADSPAASPSGAAKPAPSAPATAGANPATGVPASAWTASNGIPMAAQYHWGALAGAAQAVNNPKFEFEQLCMSARDPSNDLADWKGPAARSHLAAPGQDYADWQVQQTVVHFPGTSSGGAQLANALFQGLSDELNACGRSTKGAQVKVTGTGGDNGNSNLAATVTVPETSGGSYTLHQYLSLTGRTVTELALWSDHPAHPWSAPADAEVLKALESPLCSSFKDC
ncbi:hypothetical protein [Saccharothrix sp. ST-888]|uniref:hypothetical protein n=1 Tax=Saccharothrix sp. ST-888 TaxID=1427391 RepID=UPI0005EC8E84|nr:hypothetical protein [Saccharothrix sp. ST-888]KJK58684.1 hypothetical protein UK12_08940 [Saccharothrix sp. ST-888]